MKTSPGKSLRLIGALLLILAVTVKAGTPANNTDNNGTPSVKTAGDPIEKKKTINRSYNVSSSDKLAINNCFGTLDIKTWNKNEFKVDITITVKAKNEAEAQKLFDDIKIKEDKSGGVYSFKTEINHKGNNWNDNDKEDKDKEKGDKDWKNHKNHGNDDMEFQVDYDVYMPAANPLDAENSFGKMIVGDITGPATLTSKFGEMTAGKISNNNGLTSEFGSAKVAGVNGGKINSKFGEMTIGDLGGDAKLVSEYADNKITLNNSLTSLNIINSFASTRLDVPSGFNATVTADCSFGDLNNKTPLAIKEIRDEDNRYSMDKHYEGGSGSAKIKIKCNFGDVNLMNPGDKDLPKDDEGQGRGNHRNRDKEKHKKNKDKDEDNDA